MRRHAWRCKEAACGTLAESRFTATAAPMLQLRSSRWRMALSILRWRRMQAVWTQWMAADHDGWVEQSQSGAKGRENFCTSEPSGDFVADESPMRLYTLSDMTCALAAQRSDELATNSRRTGGGSTEETPRLPQGVGG